MEIKLDWLNKIKPGNTMKFLNLEYVKTDARRHDNSGA